MGKRASCFALTVSLMSCDSQCSVALPHGAVVWCAEWDYVISLIILTCFLIAVKSRRSKDKKVNVSVQLLTHYEIFISLLIGSKST